MDLSVFFQRRRWIEGAILYFDACLSATLLADLRLVVLEAEEERHVVGCYSLLEVIETTCS